MTDTYSLPLAMSPRKSHHPMVSPSYEYAYSTPPSSSSQGGVVQLPRHDSRAASSYSTSSISSSSYAGSAADEFEDAGMATDDLVGVLTDRLITAFDPIPLDRSLALQAQTSGLINAKNRELMELQALTQKRLSETRANFLDGMRVAKQVKTDLEWLQKRTDALKAKAEQRYPVEYNMARDKYPGDYGY